MALYGIQYITIAINCSKLIIDREFVIKHITPNFTLEMFYYVLMEFIKYDNYSLFDAQNYYTFSGYYRRVPILSHPRGWLNFGIYRGFHSVRKLRPTLRGGLQTFGHYTVSGTI